MWIVRVTLVGVCVSMFTAADVFGQQTDNYLLGDEKRLLMVVHIFGEVQRPGEYKVPDNIDVLGLLAKAGGATQFAKLNSVRLTRTNHMSAVDASARTDLRPTMHRIDVDSYLKGTGAARLPVLQPGDASSLEGRGLS